MTAWSLRLLRALLPPPRGAVAVAVAVAVVRLLASCTDVSLYDPVNIPAQANRVAFTGQVCTDNPAERSFPLRVVFLVDASAAPIAGVAAADAAALQSRRVLALRDVISSLRSRDTKFSLIRYGGDSLVQPEGGFTDNATEMAEAAATLTVAVPCTVDGCRRTGQALSIASALVTGDLLSTPRGPRSRTKYVLVIVQNGPVDEAAIDGSSTSTCDTSCVLQGRVARLREQVLRDGGADLQVHALDVATLSSDADIRAATRDELQRMTFAGAGEYQPVCARDAAGASVVPGCGPASFSLSGLDINSARNVLLKKSFVVSNLSARTTPDGTVVADSDQDGLSDDEELDAGTDPARRDTDGDGIGDLVELLLATTGLSPNRFDEPVTCTIIDPEVRLTRDSDGDGLRDCEEALLRLDPTLFDTDGDGMPDPLEVFAGTNFLDQDGLADADFDGVANLEEVRAHTDPRAADTKTRSQLSYLYREVDLGIRTLLFTSQPRTISGVVVEETGGLSTLGNGTLSFVSAQGRSFLAWRDPSDPEPGPAVLVEDSGIYRLDAACDGEPTPCDRHLTVRVTTPLLPVVSRDELLRVAAAQRQCTDFRVRNVSLVETIAADGTAPGTNDVRIFFGQVPAEATGAFPIFRVARFPFTFLAPDTKVPDVADQLVEDFQFVLFE
jgi:hypothetical protein